MANGPLFALFAIAVLAPAVGQRAAIAGFLAGLLTNLVLWLGFPQVSWLWWNVAGCLTGLGVAVTLGGAGQLTAIRQGVASLSVPPRYSVSLILAALLILGTCVGLSSLAG